MLLPTEFFLDHLSEISDPIFYKFLPSLITPFYLTNTHITYTQLLLY